MRECSVEPALGSLGTENGPGLPVEPDAWGRVSIPDHSPSDLEEVSREAESGRSFLAPATKQFGIEILSPGAALRHLERCYAEVKFRVTTSAFSPERSAQGSGSRSSLHQKRLISQPIIV
jgi:hypothetical protein